MKNRQELDKYPQNTTADVRIDIVTYFHENGFDRNGGDMYSIPSATDTWQQCRQSCTYQSEAGCIGFSWDSNTTLCWLKNTTTTRREAPTFWSGFMTTVGKDYTYKPSPEGTFDDSIDDASVPESYSLTHPRTHPLSCGDDDGRVHMIRRGHYAQLLCNHTRSGDEGFRPSELQNVFDSPTWDYCGWLCLTSRWVGGTGCSWWLWSEQNLTCDLHVSTGVNNTWTPTASSGLWGGRLLDDSQETMINAPGQLVPQSFDKTSECTPYPTSTPSATSSVQVAKSLTSAFPSTSTPTEIPTPSPML